ncbi:zinc finger protein 260 isoform X2 [Bicyclus anynana]|uniref:Zinc finger protein 260 isoform X2 n=1 Tax=Bicyclus anynana TaxID=110368 RepID=A0ABM3M5J9_BICAN|nr:zinc finger protein 260 isoform X2 [Bicyclus anynana]
MEHDYSVDVTVMPSSMSTVQFCMICLGTDSKLYPASKYYLDVEFNCLTGISLQEEMRFVPQFCTECAQRLVNCGKFREKSLRGYHLLSQLLESQESLTIKNLKSISRADNNLVSDIVTKISEPNHWDLKLVHNKISIKGETDESDNESVKYVGGNFQKSNNKNCDDDIFIKSGDKIKDVLNKDIYDMDNSSDDGVFYNYLNSDVEYLEDDMDDVVRALARDTKVDRLTNNRNGTRTNDDYAEYIYIDDDGNTDENFVEKDDCSTLFDKLKHSADGKCNFDDTRDMNGVFLNGPEINKRKRIKGAFYERSTGKRVVFLNDKLDFEKDSDGYSEKGNKVFPVKSESYLSYKKEDEKYMCPHCGDEFRQKTSYMNHTCSRTIKDKVCPFCGFSFIGDKGLKMHLVKKHQITPPVDAEKLNGPTCGECDIRFETAAAYARHMSVSPKHGDADAVRLIKVSQMRAIRRPRGYGALDCEHCGVSLSTVREYSKHTKKCVTAGDCANCRQGSAPRSPAICEHCGKAFKNEHELKDHVGSHSGIKPYKCNICQKRFAFRVNLTRHRHLHLETRPRYQCVQCGQEFAHKQNTWRHMLSHHSTAPQLYKCEVCGKMLTTAKSKLQHIQHVHEGLPWPKRVRPPRAAPAACKRLVRHTRLINAAVSETP